MKHLNRFNENWVPDEDRLVKGFTEDDKKFFDDVFAEFIDMGATSELYESEVTHFQGQGLGGNSYKQKVKRYRIFLNLANMASKKYRPSRIIDLVKYTEELNELVLEVQSCFNKIKEEEDYQYIGSHTHTNKESKVRLNYDGYDEGEVPDRFNLILQLYK
jgi:hypothetical protein